jgi:hypothetical protein
VRILFVGQLGVGQTSRMRMEVLRALGHEIVELDSQLGWSALPWPWRRAQQALAAGPTVSALNRGLLSLARARRPDLVWGEKQEYLHPDTLDDLARLGARTLHFTPDPYFTLSWKRTRLQDRCLPRYDYVLACKRYELDQYRRSCRKVVYVPLGFDEQAHQPREPPDAERRRAFASEVGFIGGWEPRRERLLTHLLRATGCRLKVWGSSWDHLVDGKWTPRRAVRLWQLSGGDRFHLRKNPLLAAALQGGELYAEPYAWALSGARIGVGFLRTVCPDQHTTRSFEIPACGSLLLADRTDEHRELFREGEEADFFGSEEELVDKVRFYLARPEVRDRVAAKGRERCLASGYSYRARLVEALRAIEAG